MSLIKRNKFLLFFLFVLLANNTAKAQNEYDVIQKGWIRFSDAPNSLYHHLANQAYDLLDKRAKTIHGIHSLPDWQKRQQWVHKTLMDIAGPFPEKTPLNAKIVNTIKKDGYKVEHIIYESQPGFYVTSSLFIPDNPKGKKLPVVIYVSGHADEGYRSPVYQRVILNLVKKGFMVFAFDPVGQGERLEYFDPKTGKSIVGETDEEHSYSTTQAFIIGSSQARYMIWDGIRAVDYLLTRKEVDPARIGMTGRSGGGTQTAYNGALDDRIKAAAPECFITNYTRIIQSIGPQDGEQNLFNGIVRGIDHADLLSVRAPKPTLLITTTRDMFNIEGARETAKEVANIYKAYGKESDFGMVEDDAPHASTKKNREALYTFFQKHLDNPGNSNDEDIELLSANELQVTKTGQVSTSLGGETVFSMNSKETEGIVNKLKVSRQSPDKHFPGIINSAKKLSGYQQPTGTADPVFTGRFQKEGYVVEKYFVKGEGDYVIPYVVMKPEHPNNKALIYLHPSGKSAESAAGGEMEWFVKNGFTVLAPDLVGVGEMGPGVFRGDSYIQGISYNVWFCSVLTGKSIAAIQAADIVRLTHLIKKNTNINSVYAVARKELAPALLHAAAFDTEISRIALIEPYSSYRSIATNRFYSPNFVHSLVPGSLKEYDIPDLAASLAPRKLMMAGVTDGAGKNIEINNEDIEIIRSAYQYKKADEHLDIKAGKSNEKSAGLFMEWIK